MGLELGTRPGGVVYELKPVRREETLRKEEPESSGSMKNSE